MTDDALPIDATDPADVPRPLRGRRAIGWREATEAALYGPGGFFVREAPAAHFRTSVHATPRYAEAVAELLCRVDEALGRPTELALVDVGAGRAELLSGVLDALPGRVAERCRPIAVERAARPAGSDPRVEWAAELPEAVRGLVFANEWLDNVPCDIAQVDDRGVWREVLVDPVEGDEQLGDPVTGRDAEWLGRWWAPTPRLPQDGANERYDVDSSGAPHPPDPSSAPVVPGARAELGRPRDEEWRRAVHCLTAGLAVAVDYGHTLEDRPPFGTLTGYRHGREVRPVPDGSCDLTSHVALDACAASAAAPRPDTERGPGREHGQPPVDAGALLSQREALKALGVDGRRPPLSLAGSDPVRYLRQLGEAGAAAELLDPAGLGGHIWLIQSVGIGNPLDRRHLER